MAHELTLRTNGMAEMAFVGATPWHHLGQNVTKGAPIETWQTQAGMDWSALEVTPHVWHVSGAGPARTAQELDFGDYKALYRSDTLAPLSIVGRDYQVVQPRDMLEFFRDLTESGGWHIHTAGTMRGGRRLWAMATCEDPIRFVRGFKGKGSADKMALNLLLATALDGSMQTTGLLTTVRVVCANTLRLAMAGRGFAQVKLSHRSTFDADLIKQALGVDVAHAAFDDFMEDARRMAETPIDLGEARDVLLKIFKPSATATGGVNLSWMGNIAEIDTQRPEPQDSRATMRILELFDGAGMGADLPTSRGTRWGLLNAVTQYVDHEMGKTPDTRLNEAWFGRGRDFKEQAVRLLAAEEA